MDQNSCQIDCGKCGRRHLGGHDLVRRMDRQGEVLIWCRTCSGYAKQRMRPKLKNGHQRIWENDEKNPDCRRRKSVPVKEAKIWKIEGEKKIITRGIQEVVKQF